MGKRIKKAPPVAGPPEPSRATVARRANASARRMRILAEGGRRVELLLPAAAADALTRLEAATDGTATMVISRLLISEGQKVS